MRKTNKNKQKTTKKSINLMKFPNLEKDFLVKVFKFFFFLFDMCIFSLSVFRFRLFS